MPSHPRPCGALVTGASSGIGRATAVRLAQEGFDVVITGRDAAALGTVAAECRATGARVEVVELDVRDAEAVHRVIAQAADEFGRGLAVVHSAAVVAYGNVEEVPSEVMTEVVNTNVFGTLAVCRAAMDAFRRTGAGHLVVVGSLLGEIATPYMSSYVLSKWAVHGLEFGFSSPLLDGNRLYQLDGASILHAFDTASGKELWKLPLGNAQKAPPVMADGKIYVGTDGGKFFIVRPGADKGEILSTVELPNSVNSCCGSEGTPEQVLAGAAVSRGRIFFVSSDAVYAIGSKQPKAVSGFAVDAPAEPGSGAPAYVQVTPTELVLTPGQTVRLHARLFDDKGRFLREDKATWALEGLKGTVTDGSFVVAAEQVDQAGLIKATVGGLTGQARARVARSLPWTETFESYADGAILPGWVNATAGRVVVATLDGQKVLQKEPLETLFKRARVFIGPTSLSNYSFEADVRAPTRRRQMGDVGITAQRYTLVLYGNSQRLKIEGWEPETTRTVTVPFAWKADTWYRLKLRVENLANGSVRAQGKAWPVGEAEPSAWTIEKVEPNGNREGAPGLFIDAQFGAMLDNFKLTAN